MARERVTLRVERDEADISHLVTDPLKEVEHHFDSEAEAVDYAHELARGYRAQGHTVEIVVEPIEQWIERVFPIIDD